MILYLDTSALVKRYFNEPYSVEVISLWKGARELVTSSAAYAETMATFYRKKRETRLGQKIFDKILESFQEEWNIFIRVHITDELNPLIHRVVAQHALRGYDAIHLASALTIHERLNEDFLFACFDRRLVQAAQLEGLSIFPQEL